MLRPYGAVAPRVHPAAFVQDCAHLFKGPAGYRLHKTSGETQVIMTVPQE